MSDTPAADSPETTVMQSVDDGHHECAADARSMLDALPEATFSNTVDVIGVAASFLSLEEQLELRLVGDRWNDAVRGVVLALTCNWGVTDLQFLDFVATFRELQSLNLRACDWLTPAAMGSVGCLPGLTALSLENSSVTDEGLVHVGGLQRLTSLNLSWAGHVTNAGIGVLCDLLVTRLRSLNLTGIDKLTDDALVSIARLTYLRSLSMSWCSRLTDDGLDCLGHLAGSLTSLSLRNCVNIECDGLESLGHLVKLEELDLGGCSRVPSAGLKHLNGLSALRWLNLAGCNRLINSAPWGLTGWPKMELLRVPSLAMRSADQAAVRGASPHVRIVGC